MTDLISYQRPRITRVGFAGGVRPETPPPITLGMVPSGDKGGGMLGKIPNARPNTYHITWKSSDGVEGWVGGKSIGEKSWRGDLNVGLAEQRG